MQRALLDQSVDPRIDDLDGKCFGELCQRSDGTPIDSRFNAVLPMIGQADGMTNVHCRAV